MIKTFSPKTCAFDCEWIPCPDTARRLLHLSPIVRDKVASIVTVTRICTLGDRAQLP